MMQHDLVGGDMSRERTLARTFVELADTLVADFDVVELLTLLADRCVEILDIEAAGLMLVGPDDELRVLASSSEAMRVLELFEVQSEEGPCLDCYRTGEPVVNQDLAAAIPEGKIKIAESGISTVENIRLFRKHGFHGFLIGENFMKQENPGVAFEQFVTLLRSN